MKKIYLAYESALMVLSLVFDQPAVELKHLREEPHGRRTWR